MLLAARSLAIPQVARCASCDYLAGARPYTIAWRDAATAILVTREQRGVGDVLVIPLACRPTLLDLSPAEAGAVMANMQRAGRVIVAAHEPAGLAAWQNNDILRDRSCRMCTCTSPARCRPAARSGAGGRDHRGRHRRHRRAVAPDAGSRVAGVNGFFKGPRIEGSRPPP